MGRMDVVTPGHPSWDELVSRVSRALICEGSTRHARVALEVMGADIEGTLKALAALGMHCDCEIAYYLTAASA